MMNLTLSNPPAGWQVHRSQDAITIRRATPESSSWPIAVTLAGTLVIVATVIAFQMIFASRGFLGALFSGTTVVALLPALGIYLLARYGKSKPASDWSYIVQPEVLVVESQFGDQREQTRIERNRILRLNGTRETEPGAKHGETVFLNAYVEKPGGIREEAYLGIFRDALEADWFCSLFEGWSGHRAIDLSPDETENPEAALGADTPPGH